jgi:hypothetical protein
MVVGGVTRSRPLTGIIFVCTWREKFPAASVDVLKIVVPFTTSMPATGTLPMDCAAVMSWTAPLIMI